MIELYEPQVSDVKVHLYSPFTHPASGKRRDQEIDEETFSSITGERKYINKKKGPNMDLQDEAGSL